MTTIDDMLRDPARVSARLADEARQQAISDRLLPPSGPTRHRFVDTPGRTWDWVVDVLSRHGRPFEPRSWFARAEHRRRRTSQITVDDLKRQARRDAMVPGEPILLGVHECRIFPIGGGSGTATITIADDGVLEIPAIQGPPADPVDVDDANTGPILR